MEVPYKIAQISKIFEQGGLAYVFGMIREELVFRNIYLKSHWPLCFKEIKKVLKCSPFPGVIWPGKVGKSWRRLWA